jgi:hypothetical protein
MKFMIFKLAQKVSASFGQSRPHAANPVFGRLYDAWEACL